MISFLFTDIEGSTRMVQDLGEAWPSTLSKHSAILSNAISGHGGVVVKTEGDSFFAVFGDPINAVEAAAEAQRLIASDTWPQPMRVRMGIHTGEAELGGDDYVGLDVHRASRIADAAHGGQVVVSEATAISIDRRLPPDVTLKDLGKYRLKDLYHPEAIFQVVMDGLEREFPTLRTLDVIPNNLPEQLTPFFGRRSQIERVVELLDRTRLLTLTGPGGTGKTRLALQVAAEVSHRYEDGVFFTGLSPVTEVDVVPSVILGSLGLSATGAESPRDRLLGEISTKRLLMVIDNFEQLMPAAELVGSMVRAAPRSQFLVTSRAPLRIMGEQELAVPPLDLPEGSSVESVLSSESAQLLIDRARSVRPDFDVDEENAADVAELIKRLDGLPLAIELVTSRLRQFSVRTIVERLDSKMLAAGSVDLPERQRTIEAAISWSYELLGDDARQLFARLSVFPGGTRIADLEEFDSMFDDRLDLLEALGELVDQSLVARRGASGDERYRMLHIIREFAAARLVEIGSSEEVHLAHLDLCIAIAEESAKKVLGLDRASELARIEAEHDNIRSAIEWGMEKADVARVLRLTSAMWRFWQARGHLHEAASRLSDALQLGEADPALRAKAMEALGGVCWWRGEIEEATDAYAIALEIQEDLGDPAEIANAKYNYGLAKATMDNSIEEAEHYLKPALEIYEEIGDANGQANVRWGLGQANYVIGNYEIAETHMAEAAKGYRLAGNEFGLGWALHEMAMLEYRRERYQAAWSYFESVLELFGRSNDVSGIALASYGVAGVAYQSGDRMRAYRLYGAMEKLVETSGTSLVHLVANVIEHLEPETIASLTGADRDAYERGRQMSAEETLAYALAGPVDPDIGV